MKKKLLLGAVFVIVVVLGFLVVATSKVEPDPPLPNPNGYEDFVMAAALIDPNSSGWTDLDRDALRALVATNRSALALVRAGFTKQCRMAPWVENSTNSTHLDSLAASKCVAQAFAAASRLALVDGHTNEAAALATDCIRYGNECARGGVIIDHLVGVAIKNIGLRSLTPSVDGLDLEASQRAIATLQAVESGSESEREIIKRERAWARQGRFGQGGFFTQLVSYWLGRDIVRKFQQKLVTSETDMRRMQIALAVHAYELEHGKPPASVKELVPDYLKSVPLDPTTGKELPLN